MVATSEKKKMLYTFYLFQSAQELQVLYEEPIKSVIFEWISKIGKSG